MMKAEGLEQESRDEENFSCLFLFFLCKSAYFAGHEEHNPLLNRSL